MEKETSAFAANCALFLLVLIAAAILRLYPQWLDWPVARALNGFTTDHLLANELAYYATYPIIESLTCVCLIWYGWFSDNSAQSRTQLVVGIAAAVFAGLICHFLRYQVAPAPKPIFDPLLQLQLPSVLGDIDALKANSFPNSPTFPSERATLFAGLSLAIFMVRTDLGLLALGCTAVVEICRIYLGLHYLTDIVGSFALAASLGGLTSVPWCSELGLWFVGWAAVSPWAFYACAFLASSQLITAFRELRLILRWITNL